jgi:NADH-quinone oxidoreductase subunit L
MDKTYNLITILLLAPLFSGMVICCVNKYLSYKLTAAITICGIAISMVLANYFLYQLIFHHANSTTGDWYIWANISKIQFKFGFLLDYLSIIIINMIAVISLFTQIYSIEYLDKNSDFNRFFIYINLLIFAMLLGVTANNLLQVLFSWQLISLSSYLLVNFYFNKQAANLAGFKAFFINSIGDCGLILVVVAILIYCNSLDYIEIFKNLPKDINTINLIAGLLFVSAVVKSAQMPLHVWLPDSIIGPIPASALIQAVTIATGGVFLLIRLFPIFQLSEYWLNIALIIGSLTACMAGILAVVEINLKRILVYSTISQLGIILIGIGGANYIASKLYLINYAVIQSLLFLMIGGVILVVKDVENIQQLPGGLKKQFPWLYWTMLIAILGIVNFPGLAGFFAKDVIIKTLLASKLTFANKSYCLLLCSACITSLYAFRLFLGIFHNNHQIDSKLKNYKVITKISVSITLLTICVVFVGPLLIKLTDRIIINNYFVNLGKMFMYGFVNKHFVCSILGFLIAAILSVYQIAWLSNVAIKVRNNFLFVKTLLDNRYFFDQLYHFLIIFIKKFSNMLCVLIDTLFVERLIENFMGNIYIKCSKGFKVLYRGYLSNYILFMFAGVLTILLWLIFITG